MLLNVNSRTVFVQQRNYQRHKISYYPITISATKIKTIKLEKKTARSPKLTQWTFLWKCIGNTDIIWPVALKIVVEDENTSLI